MSAVAERHSVTGPLWVCEDGAIEVHLWAPNAKRGHWAISWTVTDGDEDDPETLASEHARVPELDSVLEVAEQLGGLAEAGPQIRAVVALAETYDPAEPCDHSRAFSRSQIGRTDQWVCGYCGRIVETET